MKKIVGAILLLAVILSMAACMNFTEPNQGKPSNTTSNDIPNQGESEMELTARQVKILEEQNLPTNYEALNVSQKQAIVAIEEMFCYLDEKYDIPFEYLGYIAPSGLDKESLLVYPSDGLSVDKVTVIREDGVCTDDYANLYYREQYEKMIRAYFTDKVARVEVFSEIAEVSSSCDENNLFAAIHATSAIYIAEEAGIDAQQLAKDFGNWYASEANSISCSFAIYIVPENAYWSITRFNRQDYDDSVITKVNITVRADGTVVVR